MFGYEEELQDEIAKLKAENEKLNLCFSDTRSILIEFGKWLNEDYLRQIKNGRVEIVVDRFNRLILAKK